MKATHSALAVSLALLALSCGGSGSSNATSGKLTVLLKDAPAAFDAAVVTITEVDLMGSGGSLVLSTAKTTTNLLTLANDTATLVDGVDVPAGTYSQLRFVITGGYISVGGVNYASSPTYEGLPEGAVVGGELRMPSYATSGLKIDLPGGAMTLGTSARILVVDFDVSQSFGHVAGHSGAWVMHPVVKASDVVTTGALAVSLALGLGVSLPAGTTLAGFQAVLSPAAGGDNVVVPLTDLGAGDFGVTFQYLAPGDYSVTFQPPATIATFTTAPPVPAVAAVLSGQVTTLAFVLTGATVPAEGTGTLDVSLSLGAEITLPEGTFLSDFQAVATPAGGGPPASAALVDSGVGTFVASFADLAPGDYAVTLTPPGTLAGFETFPAVPVTTTVAAGEVTTVDLQLVGITL
jgi:hypothetical protein